MAVIVIFHHFGESSPVSCSAIGSGLKEKGEKLFGLIIAKQKGKDIKHPQFLI